MLRSLKGIKRIEHISLYKAAYDFKINYYILGRYGQRNREMDINDNVNVLTIHILWVKDRQVFSAGVENETVNYFLQTSNIYFGLSPKILRKPAYEIG